MHHRREAFGTVRQQGLAFVESIVCRGIYCVYEPALTHAALEFRIVLVIYSSLVTCVLFHWRNPLL